MTDVLVVGAGPTGLALACGLRLHGVRVRVVDRAAQPATTSRALVVQPAGAHVLDRLGALRELPERSISLATLALHTAGPRVTTVPVAEVVGGDAPLLVSQAEVESALRHRLGELGGSVEWGVRITGLDQDAGGVTVTSADGSRIRAGRLVGCDGAHSQVRKLTGIGFPGSPIAERFLLADVTAGWDADRSGTSGWLHRDGIVLAFPLPRGDQEGAARARRWRLMAYAPSAGGDDLDDAAVLDYLRQAFARRAGQRDLRIEGVTWTSAFRVQRRIAARYRDGRVLLAGDAAHIHSPVGGQGMNTGLGDAENLAWKLALVTDGRASDALLDTYQAERRPVAADVLSRTTLATRALTGDHLAVRLFRDHVLVHALNRPWLRRRLVREAVQPRTTYRRGPLATRSRRPARQRPGQGDRVPDLACRREDGERTRLYAELGGRWALLTADDRAVAPVREWLGDAVGWLVPVDDVRGGVRLVRPDGHLAWAGSAVDPSGLRQWLEGALRYGTVRR